MTALSRRTLLIGGGSVVLAAAAGAVLVEQRVLPGRSAAERLLGMTGPAGVVPTTAPGRRLEGSFASTARGGAETGRAAGVAWLCARRGAVSAGR